MSFFGYAGAGILFVIASAIVLGMLARAFQFADPNITGETGLVSIGELADAIVTLKPVGIAFGFTAFIVIGFLVWVFGIIGVKLRMMIGVKQDEKVSFGKRPALLAFFIAGVITVIIFAGLGAILNELTDEAFDLTSVNTLFDAITTGNPLLFLLALVGLAIVGFLVIRIAEIEKTTGEKVLPKKPVDLRFGES